MSNQQRGEFRIQQHRLLEARECVSPNFNQRPPGCEVDLLVLHNISLPPGVYASGCVEQLFLNCLDPAAHPYFAQIADLKVSSHLLIERSGQVVQFVPFDQRAWHAGQSSWAGRDNCNDYSIGIELEGTDTDPYTELQYAVLIKVVRAIQRSYPAITSERIVGHRDIAPMRKTDPGPAFDWLRLRAGLVG